MKNFPDWILFFALAAILITAYIVFRHNRLEKIDSFVKSKRNLVVLILGQSNAANYCQGENDSVKNIFMYFRKELYKAKDPILGASGNSGSIWIPVFEGILNRIDLDSILMVNIAQGSSSVKDWQPGGVHHALLQETMEGLQQRTLSPDLVLWQQGEQDNLNGMSKEGYLSAFRKIHMVLKSFDKELPVLISITSFHPRSKTPVNSRIREAQCELIEEDEMLFAGPDTDLYIDDCRYDGIHFSIKGMNLISRDWMDSIISFLDSANISKMRKINNF